MPKAPESPLGSHDSSPVPSKQPDNTDDTDDPTADNLSPAAGLLPIRLEPSHKAWLNNYISEFQSKIAKRGSRKENATIWNRAFVLTQFIPHFFPNLDLTDNDKSWFCDTVGEKIYNFFGNHTKRRTRAKPPKILIKTKCFGQDTYRKSNPEEHDAAVEALIATEYPHYIGVKLNIGQTRSLSSQVFKQLPAEEQAHWRRAAKEALLEEQTAARLTDPQARERYVSSLIRLLQEIVAEAGQKANVRVAIQVLTEQSENRFKLQSLVSSNLSDFAKSQAIAELLHALKVHVEESVEGGQVEGNTPLADIFIDWANNGQPLIPDIAGMDLHRLRRLSWDYVKYKYAQGSGVGKVPWEEIGCSLDEWIDPERRPPGWVWSDPGSMTLANVLLLLDWIGRCQSRDLGPESAFQFKKTNAGSNPIDTSDSQETGREKAQYKGQDVYFLKFNDRITKCHAVGGIDGMKYSKSSIAYTLFRLTGSTQPNKVILSALAPTPAPLPEWMNPPFGADVPRSVFFGAEKETLLSVASMTPREHGERVENLVRLTNELQSHLPASNELGPWAAPVAPPILMPAHPMRSPLVPFFVPIWAVIYFKTPMSMEETIFHIESWLLAILKSGVLIHEPSGTLLGGDFGVVWVVRVLLKVFLNFVGVKYRIQFPGSIPDDCDVSRLPLGEWPRLLKQMDTWAQLLRDSIAILQRTSEAHSLGLPSTNDADTELHELVDGGARTLLSLVKRRRSSKNKSRKSSKDEGSGSEEFEGDEGSSVDGETNFEALDRRSDEDDDNSKDYEEEDHGDHSFDYDAAGRGGSGLSIPVPSGTVTSSAQESTEAHGLTHNEAAPQSNPHNSISRRLVPWKKRSNAFGSFFVIQKYRSAIPNTAVGAIQAIDIAERAWASASQELRLLCNIYNGPLELSPNQLAEAQAAVSPLLAEYILRRRAAWARTETLAQSLLEIAARILESFRHILAFHSIIQGHIELMEEAGHATGKYSPDIDIFTTRVETSGIILVEARWTYTELVAFESLTTKFLNKSQGDWLSGPLPSDLVELHRAAQAQIEWMDAFSKLQVDQVEKRKALWAPVTESPFPPKHLTSGMRFAFGNPIASEEPAGLRDALASATEELALPPPSAQLASDTDMENITHAIIDKDVIMANTQSSAPVTQQNTALEPLGVTAEETGQKLRATLADFNAPVMSVPFVEPALSVLDPAAPANSAIACDSAAHTTSIAPAPAPVAPVAPAAPVAPVVPVAPVAPVAPAASATSTSTNDSAPPGPFIAPSTSTPTSTAAVEDTPQKSAGRKRAAPKSNEPDAGSRRVSARHAAVQDDDTQARQTRAGSKRVKETVVGKGTQRKSKGRR